MNNSRDFYNELSDKMYQAVNKKNSKESVLRAIRFYLDYLFDYIEYTCGYIRDNNEALIADLMQLRKDICYLTEEMYTNVEIKRITITNPELTYDYHRNNVRQAVKEKISNFSKKYAELESYYGFDLNVSAKNVFEYLRCISRSGYGENERIQVLCHCYGTALDCLKGYMGLDQ